MTFESVFVELTVFMSHVLYTHIMCDKMYHPKNNAVLVWVYLLYYECCRPEKYFYQGRLIIMVGLLFQLWIWITSPNTKHPQKHCFLRTGKIAPFISCNRETLVPYLLQRKKWHSSEIRWRVEIVGNLSHRWYRLLKNLMEAPEESSTFSFLIN